MNFWQQVLLIETEIKSTRCYRCPFVDNEDKSDITIIEPHSFAKFTAPFNNKQNQGLVQWFQKVMSAWSDVLLGGF